MTRVNVVSRYPLPMIKTERFAHYEYVGVVCGVTGRGYGIKDPIIMLIKSLLEALCKEIDSGALPERNVLKFIARMIDSKLAVNTAVSKDFEINCVICRLTEALETQDGLDDQVVALKCSLLKLCVALN